MEKLHQTTTKIDVVFFGERCILWKNYIKPQQIVDATPAALSCILWKNYIKPQLFENDDIDFYVVSYGKTTSNHNFNGYPLTTEGVVSYGKTTSNHNFS